MSIYAMGLMNMIDIKPLTILIKLGTCVSSRSECKCQGHGQLSRNTKLCITFVNVSLSMCRVMRNRMSLEGYSKVVMHTVNHLHLFISLDLIFCEFMAFHIFRSLYFCDYPIFLYYNPFMRNIGEDFIFMSLLSHKFT